uniref:Uncharacterized protein n=1 Tax=Arion vulgaris TaxID=1028688 RepID=A0A0B6ZZF5_9EUPU
MKLLYSKDAQLSKNAAGNGISPRLPVLSQIRTTVLVLFSLCAASSTVGEQIPSFAKLKSNYPGYAHFGGAFNNHDLISAIGCNTSMLLHDTSALRLSVTLNKIGGVHSLGKELIRLSKYGRDSVTGLDGLQYIYHPIAYGPYLADKYGYPNVSKLHDLDPVDTKKNFWGKQGLLRVITYTKKKNMPRGHVALWDCNHFHQARDWIAGHSLITAEFWQSSDSDCSHIPDTQNPPTSPDVNELLAKLRPDARPIKLRHRHWEKHFIEKYYQLHKSTFKR